MVDVSFSVALLAGLLSFLSPCVLPLVPPYLGYLAGLSLDQLTGEGPSKADRRTVFFASVAFVLGFSTVFVLLGAAATFLGQLLRSYLDILTIVGGGIIIVMGLHFLGVFKIGLLLRQARIEVRNTRAGPLGAYAMGLAFAFGWTPCIGPVLAVILGLAGAEDTVGSGAVLLAVYSAGLGLPFIVAGLFAGSFMRFMKRFRSHVGTVEKTMGAMLVVTGVLFVTGQFSNIAFWLLETFPGLAQLG
ncbi:MAG: cytochrome c biogenesis protein CcdA [Hyphomicrobiales bacterium]|nr:cytochrome c biogenesis protein CcdA [Hyphomicrobiales bacterium]